MFMKFFNKYTLPKIRILNWLGCCWLVTLFLSVGNAWSASYFELGVGTHIYDLKISPRNSPDSWVDDSQSLNLSIAAYRKSTERSAWGSVIEINSPTGRDSSLPGSGQILSFRPVNYQFTFQRNFLVELYGGIAQYDWIKTANGYCFGLGLRYQFGPRARWSLAFDGKYYMELAYDSSQGDDFVNGFNPGAKLFYRF